MKWNVIGFNQEEAVKLGLNVDDLVILRWFTDFYGTKRMKQFQTDGKTYALVNYGYFLEDMPIFKCNKRTLAAKFKHLVDAGVLEYCLIKDSGTFSVYGFGEKYDALVYDASKHCSDPLTKSYEGCQKNSNGYSEKQQRGCQENGIGVVEKTATKDPSTINHSAINPSTKITNGRVVDESLVPQSDSTTTLMERFEIFYKAYPKHKSRGDAEKAWKSLKPSDDLLAEIIAGLEAAKKSQEWIKDGGQYIPYPATWLRAKGWKDEQTESLSASESHTDKKSGWGGYLC